MAAKEYLDKQGLLTLWERIQQFVYECGCACAVKYHLETDGETVTLVGSDGSRSTVAVPATVACTSNQPITME